MKSHTASRKVAPAADRRRPAPDWTMDQLRHYFGMIPSERILLEPAPGRAREKDALWMIEHGGRLCELVDGVLVEKAMGYKESLLASMLIHYLGRFVMRRGLGIVLGEAGFVRLVRGLIRAPDVSFISWDRIPGGRLPDEPIPDLVPDLAVEVVSRGNTRAEISQKLREYFAAGVSVVWVIYPRSCCVDVHRSRIEKRRLQHDQVLDGGTVPPGFKLPLKTLFAPPRRRGR